MTDVGDLLVVRNTDWFARLIRLGAAIGDEPNLDNHVAIVHHQDANGTWWVIEGRPGGVGWAAASTYLASPYTTNNALQQKTKAQRDDIATVARGMLGTPYDWAGIVADGMDAIGVQDIWSKNWQRQGAPAHVVCSSLAAWVYQKVGLDVPETHAPRFTTPADWEQFIITRGYAADGRSPVATG